MKGKAGAIGAIITLAYVNTHVYVVVGIMMGFLTELTTFLVLFFFSLFISAGLTVFKFRKKIFHCGTSKPLPANSSEEISKELLEEILVDVSKSPEHPSSNIGDLEINDSEEEDSRDSHFRLISGLTSVWLPCVVGSQPHLFLTSAMLSMTNKICLLVLAVLLNYSGSIQTNVFLLWCTNFEDTENLGTVKVCQESLLLGLNDHYRGIPTCFSFNHNPNDTQLHQLRRICGSSEEENLLRLLQLLLVIGSTCLSSVAAYQLHKISDYVYLYKISNKFCGFQTKRIVHRSLLFRLSENDRNQVQLAQFLKDSPPAMINRTRRGETALHISTRAGAHVCSILLLQAKAQIKRNSFGEFPDLLRNVDLIDKLNQSNITPDWFWKLAYKKFPYAMFCELARQKNSELESNELEQSIIRLAERLQIPPKKCGFVGDGGGGKSALISTQATGQFPSYYGGICKSFEVPFLLLEDTQGQEEFIEMRKVQLQKIDVLILCFSIANPDALENAKSAWVKEFSKYYPEAPILLLGTQMDLRDNPSTIEELRKREKSPTTTEQGQRVANELRAVRYMECSALTKVGLQDVFDEIFKIAHQLNDVI